MSAVSPARRAAYDVLRRVFEDGAYADRVLRTASQASTRATGRSRGSSRSAPSSAPARSTTRSRRSASGRCGKLDLPVLAALRLGAYQLGFLDGVPRYAAVNESVGSSAGHGSSAPSPSRTPSSGASPTGSRRCSRRSPMVRSSTPTRLGLGRLARDLGEEAALR